MFKSDFSALHAEKSEVYPMICFYIDHSKPFTLYNLVGLYLWSSMIIKVIRKFFLRHNNSLRWHLGDYEKHNFFHLKASERRNFDLCVF